MNFLTLTYNVQFCCSAIAWFEIRHSEIGSLIIIMG